MPICDCPDCIVHTCRGPNGRFRPGRLLDAVAVRNHKAKHEAQRLAARFAARAQQEGPRVLSPEESAIVFVTMQEENKASGSLPVRARDQSVPPSPTPPPQGRTEPKVCFSTTYLIFS